MQAITVESPVTVPSGAQAIIDVWNRYRAVADAYLKGIAESRVLEAQERGLNPDEDGHMFIVYEFAVRIKRKEIAQRALESLIRFAEKHFAPPDARLQIALSDDLPGTSLSDDGDLDLSAVWQYLAGNYGGSRGVTKAYRDAARSISDAFSIRAGTDFKRVGGRVVLTVETHAGAVVSSHERTLIPEVLRWLSGVGEWGGVLDVGERVDLQRVGACLSRRIRPERCQVGEALLVVPFQHKYEFRLSSAFAEKLNLFLGEFLAPSV